MLATMVDKSTERIAADAIQRVAYGKRFREALGDLDQEAKRAKFNALAAAMGVSYTYVSAIYTKGALLSARFNSIVARELGVDPDWLATGVGEMRSERTWPFAGITPAEWFAMQQSQRAFAESMLRPVVPLIKRRETIPIVDSGPRRDVLHRLAAQKQSQSSKGKRKG